MRRLCWATACLFVAACAPTDTTQSVDSCHWIGTLNPLTGDLGTVGLPLENAAKLAVADVNAAGLVANKPLCVAAGDTRTNPDRAPPIIDALVDLNQIIAVNGAAASSSTLNSVDTTDGYSMALISCCSTSPLLTQDARIYRTVPSDNLQGVAIAQLAAERDVERVSVIYLNDAYGNELLSNFTASFATLTAGRNVMVKTVPYEPNSVGYADVAQAAFASPEPQLLVLIAFPLAGAEIIKAWRESRLAQEVQWIGTDGLKDDSFVFLIGDDMPQFVGTAPASNSPYYEGFRQRYLRTYGGEEPGIFTANQYDAVILIALALSRAGPGLSVEDYRNQIRETIPLVSRPPGAEVNADDLKTALSRAAADDVDYQGVSGVVDLDDAGDVIAGYRRWSIAEGGGPIQEENVCYDCGAVTATAGVSCRSLNCEDL